MIRDLNFSDKLKPILFPLLSGVVQETRLSNRPNHRTTNAVTFLEDLLNPLNKKFALLESLNFQIMRRGEVMEFEVPRTKGVPGGAK